jgi:DDE superfamily endonuclease
MTSSHTLGVSCQWFSILAGVLDRRSMPRLVRLWIGAVLSSGRRTVTSWIRAAGLSSEFRPCYTTVAAAGRCADRIAGRLLHTVLGPLLASLDRVVLGVDDTPTPRYGPHVEGAGVHHNPTPGPAGSAFLYGHCWVVLGLLAPHRAWGVIALPLLSRLYVRRKNLSSIPLEHRPEFRTKLELTVELVERALFWLGLLGKSVWLVADGAYATGPLLKRMKELGVTMVSRLRKDAALWTVPGPRRPGQRGAHRKYGERRISLALRAKQRRGWRTATFELYGKLAVKRYKTFVATWRPAIGAIRVVMVDEPDGWRAFFCTDTKAPVADILGYVADRFALETMFRDVKDVVGAGQQQVRFVEASVGSFHLCLWTFTLTEWWAWERPEAELVNRSASPWDDASRRPSHADKRRAFRRELLGEEIQAVLRRDPTDGDYAAIAERLLALAV